METRRATTPTFLHAQDKFLRKLLTHVFLSQREVETDRNLVSVSVTAPKPAIFLVSVTSVIVKHGFGLLSVTAKTTTRFLREPKLSLLAIR